MGLQKYKKKMLKILFFGLMIANLQYPNLINLINYCYHFIFISSKRRVYFEKEEGGR